MGADLAFFSVIALVLGSAPSIPPPELLAAQAQRQIQFWAFVKSFEPVTKTISQNGVTYTVTAKKNQAVLTNCRPDPSSSVFGIALLNTCDGGEWPPH